jgi:hypothetical protein
MIKQLSILLLLLYSFLLSGSLLSVGHSFLHATSSITGIHQHQAGAESHSHSHLVADHGDFFKDLVSFSNDDKEFFTDISFILFYYEPTFQLNDIYPSLLNICYSSFKTTEIRYNSLPQTPPPDQL